MDTQFDSEYDNEILGIFLEEVEGYLPELEGQLARLSSKPKDKDALEVAHRLAHTIKGTAASLGFQEVSSHGLMLEQALTPVVEKKAVFTPELGEVCQSHVADLKKLLAELHHPLNQIQEFATPEPIVTAPVELADLSVTETASAIHPISANLIQPEPVQAQVEARPVQETYPTELPAVPQVSLEVENQPTAMVLEQSLKESEAGKQTSSSGSSWLDEAAELFSFDDLQPLDFIQKLEQRQPGDATKNGGPRQEEAAYELPAWLRDIPLPADLTNPPASSTSSLGSPFLNTAGLPQPDPANYKPLDLPPLDDLLDLEQFLATPVFATPPEVWLPPVPLDVSTPVAAGTNETAWPEPAFSFSQPDAATELEVATHSPAEVEAQFEADLVELPDLQNLTDDEAAMLAASDFYDSENSDDEGFGFDTAPMWLAEGLADIDRLGVLVNGELLPPAQAEISQLAGTLRKGAEVMELPAIGSQLRVMEARVHNQPELQIAYEDLLRLLQPHSAAAQAILNPPAVEFVATEASTAYTHEQSVDAASLYTHQSPAHGQPTQGVEVDKELAEVFASEAQEHIQNLDSRLAALERDPQNRELIREIRRTAHTLKGSAAMVGFQVISQTGHLMEDLLDKLFDGSLEINSAIVELLFATFSAIEKMVSNLAAGQTENPTLLETLRPRYEAMLGASDSEVAAGGAVIFERKGTQLFVPGEATTPSESPPVFETDLALAATAGLDMELAVRVPISRLDGMMNQVGELVINRTILEQRNQVYNHAVEEMALSVRRLQRISHELETRYEVELLKSSRIGAGVTVGAGTGNGNGGGYGGYGERTGFSNFEPEFDTLEMDRYTEFHTLSREMSETVSDLATLQRELNNLHDDLDNVSVQQSRLTDDLQDRLVKVRLVPLSNLTPRLYRTVRMVAASQNKEIEFVVSGDTTQVDKTIFEEIGDPLLHLIRNAVDHGIELTAQRLAGGKKAVATIGFAARSEGSEVIIEISDDGHGIELEALRERGIERGFLNADAHPSEEEIYNLMFLPGFSTSETISEISGRGVGLDVVRANIARLKGTIEIASEPGRGTTFSIRLPNTLAITRALLVKAAGYVYAIPLNVIEETTRLEQKAVIRGRSSQGRGSYYRYNDRVLPLYHLTDLLHLPAHARPSSDNQTDEEGNPSVKRERPLLIINGPQPYALLIDTLEGQQEVVVKGLGSHLKTVRGVVGATILGSGQVILILNVYELLDRSSLRQISGYAPGGVRTGGQLLNLETGRVLSEAELRERELADLRSRDTAPLTPPPPKSRRTPIIQVVDDSLSIRKVLSNALEKAGFRVRTSKDGQEALETIQQNAPDLIIMDIEMPRMDGYQLTSILKSDTTYQAIPVVMLTSRAGLKHRQKAEEVGADGFLVKPYKEEELLGIISTLLVR